METSTAGLSDDDSRVPTAVSDLTEWWIALARSEADRVVPKAVEYGANDLVEIGRQLAQAAGGMGLFGDDAPPDAQERFAELGVYFYLVGKLARCTSAIQEGRRPSGDTLHDIGVYVRMWQRIRAVGSWPGVQLDSHSYPVLPATRLATRLAGWPPDPPGLTVVGREATDSGYWLLDDDSGRRYVGSYLRTVGSADGPHWYRIWPLDGSLNGPPTEKAGHDGE